MYKNSFVSHDDKLFQIKAKYHASSVKDPEGLKSLLQADAFLIDQMGMIYFCNTIPDAEILEEIESEKEHIEYAIGEAEEIY
jgi:hypothetical protein